VRVKIAHHWFDTVPVANFFVVNARNQEMVEQKGAPHTGKFTAVICGLNH